MWCYESEKLDRLPRNMNGGYAKIKLPSPKPQFFSVEEVQRMYREASERTRLYILLGLGLGYCQTDIATLEHAHVDWKTGIVTRTRHKTDVPQRAKMWPIALELLRQHATDPKKSKLVLLGEKGKPLVHERLREDDKESRTDAVGLAFARLKSKLRIRDNRGFKTFRKMGADLIENKYPNPDKTYSNETVLVHRELEFLVA